MQICLKTSGLLKKYLPEGSEGGVAKIEVPDNATIFGVLCHIGARIDGNYLITVNGSAIPPSTRGDVILNDGDTMSLMPPLKGG